MKSVKIPHANACQGEHASRRSARAIWSFIHARFSIFLLYFGAGLFLNQCHEHERVVFSVSQKQNRQLLRNFWALRCALNVSEKDVTCGCYTSQTTPRCALMRPASSVVKLLTLFNRWIRWQLKDHWSSPRARSPDSSSVTDPLQHPPPTTERCILSY